MRVLCLFVDELACKNYGLARTVRLCVVSERET
jgi:hypothetical protein